MINADVKYLIRLYSDMLYDIALKNGGLRRKDIVEIVENHQFSSLLDAKQRKIVLNHLQADIEVDQSSGSIVTEEVKPWLNGRKGDIEFYYWDRLRRMMMAEKKLPPLVISRLDQITDQILDCCGNPADTDHWDARGMVVGHVQSGKTTNYSALITKAADAGYKIIILLAGITNSLRTQTQQRIDENFVGRKSYFDAAVEEILPIVSYSGGDIRKPDIGTSRSDDFRKNSIATETPLDALKVPKIFVIKKNKSVLENLENWLRSQRPANGKIPQPLLMIDDEADNASINTAKDVKLPTTINRLIREILQNFGRSTYVGYTATPFANIFIEPETDEDMANEDLFPRNFIKSLDPPDNYYGALKIFSSDGELRESMVTVVDDYQDIFPHGHKKVLVPESMPPSLKEAIRCFLIAKAIRVLRGDGHKHSSMMINVSRFNDVQDHVESLVYSYLEDLRNSVAINANSHRMPDKNFVAIRETFEKEFFDCGNSFDELRKVLHKSNKTIQVVTVNGKKKGNLNYEANSEHGLHVIAIGGLALSRGLTLEGLCSTYILRRAGAYDTLMQMARWFGYRPGYKDLCKLFLPEESVAHYENTTEAIEELREELKNMDNANLTPREFGLKVRQSPTGIRITAASKMRTAEEFVGAANYSGKFVQGFAIRKDQSLNTNNYNRIKEFLSGQMFKSLAGKHYISETQFNSETISRLLLDFNFPELVLPLTRLGSSSLMVDYIRSCNEDNKLLNWDVAIASRISAVSDTSPITDWIPGKAINLVSRSSSFLEKKDIKFTKKNAVADQDSVKIGLSKDNLENVNKQKNIPGQNVYCRVRTKPMLIIFPISPSDKLIQAGLGDVPLVTLACCIPPTTSILKPRRYQANSVFQAIFRNQVNEEMDDDEEVIYGDQ
jgi:hypothetical protein